MLAARVVMNRLGLDQHTKRIPQSRFAYVVSLFILASYGGAEAAEPILDKLKKTLACEAKAIKATIRWVPASIRDCKQHVKQSKRRAVRPSEFELLFHNSAVDPDLATRGELLVITMCYELRGKREAQTKVVEEREIVDVCRNKVMDTDRWTGRRAHRTYRSTIEFKIPQDWPNSTYIVRQSVTANGVTETQRLTLHITDPENLRTDEDDEDF